MGCRSHALAFTPWHPTVATTSRRTNDGHSNKPVHTLSFIQTPLPPDRPRKTPDFVAIHLLLLRLKEQGTDIMITINAPHYPGEYEKAEPGEKTALMKEGDEVAKKVLETFDIKDWGLFQG